MTRLLTARNTLFFVALLTLWRLDLATHLQLHPDEAYYWLWSRHLDLSYFDHPPMVAYFIRLTTVFSQAETWIRMTGVLVPVALSALTWRLALHLFQSVPVAAGSVVVVNAYPFSTLAMLVMTPDVPLLFFSTLCIYFYLELIHRSKAGFWYLTGLAFGMALLSKYTAVLLAPCLFLHLLFSEGRRWLRTPHPYLALLLGLLCFLPVVLWNERHDWISFVFQFRHGLTKEEPSLDHVLTYIGGQMLVAGPLLWLLGVYAALHATLTRDRRALLLASLSIPVIAFFAWTSYRTTAGPNWPMFVYVPFAVLLSHYGLSSAWPWRRGLWTVGVLSSLLLSAVLTLHARFGLLPLARYAPHLAAADATNHFYGWRELGQALLQEQGLTFVRTPSHQLSAEIIYYTRERIASHPDPSSRPSQFTLWGWPAGIAAEGSPGVWTDTDLALPTPTASSAEASTITFHGQRDGRIIRRYYLMRAHAPSAASSPASH